MGCWKIETCLGSPPGRYGYLVLKSRHPKKRAEGSGIGEKQAKLTASYWAFRIPQGTSGGRLGVCLGILWLDVLGGGAGGGYSVPVG